MTKPVFAFSEEPNPRLELTASAVFQGKLYGVQKVWVYSDENVLCPALVTHYDALNTLKHSDQGGWIEGYFYEIKPEYAQSPAPAQETRPMNITRDGKHYIGMAEVGSLSKTDLETILAKGHRITERGIGLAAQA